MSSLSIAGTVLVCVFGSALVGMLLAAILPDEHLGQDSKDVVKLAMGLIATMAALVLGLLTASAQETFRTWDGEIKQSAADVIMLDRVLAHYGSETQVARSQLKQVIALRLAQTWPEEGGGGVASFDSSTTPTIEAIDDEIRELTPQNDLQRGLQSRAAQLNGTLQATRWLLLTRQGSSVPTPLLVILVLWLSALAASFGLFAPRNPTVIGALFVCALSVSASIFLILELSSPLSGLMKISSAPLHYALAQLGR
jgi:hypothetical protein